MKLRTIISIFFIVAAFFSLSQTTSAKTNLTNNDKREIMRQILQMTNFTDALEYVADGTLFLSTENIPVGIQNNFPFVKGVKFQFITPEEIEKSFLEVHRFAFGEFKAKKQSVEIEFKEINSLSMEGTGYLCRKIKGKWKIRVNKIIWEMS